MRLPIKALRELAKRYGYSHVVAYAYDAKNKMQHIATWGRTIYECDQAAQFGNFMKDALLWPESLHAAPNRVKKLQKHNKELEAVGELMSNVFFNWSQQERFTPEERKMMKDLQTQWDVIHKKAKHT
jgi:hypothetical protein